MRAETASLLRATGRPLALGAALALAIASPALSDASWPTWAADVAAKHGDALEVSEDDGHVYLSLSYEVRGSRARREIVERGVVAVHDSDAWRRVRVRAAANYFQELRSLEGWSRCGDRVEHFDATVTFSPDSPFSFDEDEITILDLPQMSSRCLLAYESTVRVDGLPQDLLRLARRAPVREISVNVSPGDAGRAIVLFSRRGESTVEEIDRPRRWTFTNVAALERRESWWDPAPSRDTLIVSHAVDETPPIRTWSDVVQWDRAVLARMEDGDTPRFDAKVATLRADTPLDLIEDVIADARGLRYFAVSLDWGGFVPRSPEQALERSMGDCKDKTILAVAMLEHFGIDAVPVLFVARHHRHVDEAAPSPFYFNHMVLGIPWRGRAVKSGMTVVDVPDRGPLRIVDVTLPEDYGDDVAWFQAGAAALPIYPDGSSALIRLPLLEPSENTHTSSWSVRRDEKGDVHFEGELRCTGSFVDLLRERGGRMLSADEIADDLYAVVTSACRETTSVEVESLRPHPEGGWSLALRFACPHALLEQGTLRQLTLPPLLGRRFLPSLPVDSEDRPRPLFARSAASLRSEVRIELGEKVIGAEAPDLVVSNELGRASMSLRRSGDSLTLVREAVLERARVADEERPALKELRRAVARMREAEVGWIVASAPGG